MKNKVITDVIQAPENHTSSEALPLRQIESSDRTVSKHLPCTWGWSLRWLVRKGENKEGTKNF